MANLNEMIENESVILEKDSSKLPAGVLARVSRTVCWIDERNANNRKYGKDVWETVFSRDDFKRKMDNRQILGEYEHPQSSALKLDKDRTSHIVSKMYIGDAVMREGYMMTPIKAEFDLLPTDAGRFILILHEAGVKVGASTRADGSLREDVDETGHKFMRVIAEDYRFVTIDHTGDPSCSSTEPDSLISAVQTHYENKTINKNVAIALLESVKTEAAKALEKIILEDKEVKTNIKEELTTSSDMTGQPADLGAAKDDMEDSKKRGEVTDKKLTDINNQPVQVATQEAKSGKPCADCGYMVPAGTKECPRCAKKHESKVDEAMGDKVRQFLQDNWELFLTDQELSQGGNPSSKVLDAVRNVEKVFGVPHNLALQYVEELNPGVEQAQPAYTPAVESKLRESYLKDVLRLMEEIKTLGQGSKTLMENYEKDSLTFIDESMTLKKKIVVLEKDLTKTVSLKNEAVSISENSMAQHTALLTEQKTRIEEMNEKTNKLARELAAKESAIRDAEKTIKSLQETNEKAVKELKESHLREKVSLYVNYRVKSMGLKLHENVVTILRQAKTTTEVDTLIRETQDALREGLTQSVGEITELKIPVPVDKNQVDITNKVAIALEHFTGIKAKA